MHGVFGIQKIYGGLDRQMEMGFGYPVRIVHLVANLGASILVVVHGVCLSAKWLDGGNMLHELNACLLWCWGGS